MAMMKKSEFIEYITELAKEIEALGYDSETALKYASMIGDTPICDDEGNIVIVDKRDPRKVIAKLNLRSFRE